MAATTNEAVAQSVINVGTLGHIDHGKTSLTRAITHTWTDRHSESIKRNMTIKLGYAETVIKRCENCKGPEGYTTGDKCDNCGGKVVPLEKISMLDAPGHETLMATAIAGSSVIDAILFVIAANEPCPMQQTKEHLMIINILGVKNVIVIQTKVDIIGKEAAKAHEIQIRNFLKGSTIENAPIVPVMSNLGINVDVVLEMIANIPMPVRDLESDPLMYVVRSFDVNKPGIDATKLVGGVIGGAITKGRLKVGDKIEIKPGIRVNTKSKKDVYETIVTVIERMDSGAVKLDVATPGGLIGISTELDPTFTKADGLVGNVVGLVGKTPPTLTTMTLKYHKLKRDDVPEQHMAENEPLILGMGTTTIVGYIKKVKKDNIEVELKHPICADKSVKIAIMRNIAKRWRLTGYGLLSG
ncbi:MAG TPA: translation initiation factor IF-2 subunit gamma [Candidatus Baltobacteraceae bacterium]|nr:translation initiation factor IF-2 subunit gamma [Candidatus Baltobacteraceae bacterium]